MYSCTYTRHDPPCVYLFTGSYWVGQVKDNEVCVFIFISSDPSLIPSHVIPVFQALTGGWEVIASYLMVPHARAKLFRERFSVPDQRTEAGRYYALYERDHSWKTLSRCLYRAAETEALQIARPYIQTVTGTVRVKKKSTKVQLRYGTTAVG